LTTPIPRVLSIAGTDPTGGAGIHADLKSIAANGGYGMAVVTALVVQNTHGIRSVHLPPTRVLREQLAAVSDDVTIDAVKIGMLGSTDAVAAVERWLHRVRPPVVVLDPVLHSSSGRRLLPARALRRWEGLLSSVDLLTPNLPELATLLGEPIAASWERAVDQGVRLSDRLGTAVLVKGGHLGGNTSPDALVAPRGVLSEGRSIIEVPGPRIQTRNTHGTGCSLSSALATLQPQFGDWHASLVYAKDWLSDALRHADELRVGTGNGPLHHFHRGTAAGPLQHVRHPQNR
jgi:hydroxymethylpyrimidine kinase/phosphomethylpyrimidine kinase